MRKGIDCKGVEWEERELSVKSADPRGQKFGKLTPVLPVKAKGKAHWLCECDCKNLIAIRFSNLNAGTTQSCGCLHKEVCHEDHLKIVGQKFSRLLVVDYDGERLMPDGVTVRHMYKCVCDCGNELYVAKSCLTTGRSQSCGCIQRDVVTERWENFRKDNDIVGMVFGKLTVVSFAGVVNQVSTYNCKCECGTTITCYRSNLINGFSQSCGCISSLGELHIREILNEHKINYKPQYTFSDLLSKKGYNLRFDFGIIQNKNLVRLIEFDGPQHKNPAWFLCEKDFEILCEHDNLKNQYALSHNIPLVRIPYSKRDTMTIEDLLGDKYLIKGEI